MFKLLLNFLIEKSEKIIDIANTLENCPKPPRINMKFEQI